MPSAQLKSSVLVDIILPNRLGDALLTLPALICLKQLQSAGLGQPIQLRLYVAPPLLSLFQALGGFDVRHLGWREKFCSLSRPAAKTFFLASSRAQLLGYRTQETYGFYNAHKPKLTYSHNMAYLNLFLIDDLMPQTLVQHLREKCQFSAATIRYFGICLELGYSPETLLKTFRWDTHALNLPDTYSWCHENSARASQLSAFSQHLDNGHQLRSEQLVDFPEHRFLAMCMEAAYGKRRAENRRWKAEAYFSIAEEANKMLGLQTVFVGLETKPKLPEKPYFHDLRGKKNVLAVASILSRARAYIGNDSGLLHLASIVGVPSVGLYLANTPTQYGPIFPMRMLPVMADEGAEGVLMALKKIVIQNVLDPEYV